MRLGEHQLVRTLRLEQHGQPVERAGEPTCTGVDCEPADHLDHDAAVRGAERSFEIVERRVVTDEHEPPADARERHQLQRHRVVRGPQQGDRDRAGDDGGRDQPGGREVVVRAEAEREHDQGDEDESGEDPSGARSALARRVEAGLEEDDHRDRSEEREPVGRARLPEQRPVDRVAVDEGAKHESEVDAEREARDVRRDESGDADRASDEAEDGAAREEIDARAPDIPGLARCRVRERRGRPTRARQASSWVPRSAPPDSTRGCRRLRRARRPPTPARARVTDAATASRSAGGRRRPSSVRPATISARRRRSTRSVSWKYACTRGGSPGRTSARARSPAPCVVGTAASAPSPRSIRAGVSSSAQAAPSCEVGRPGRARRAVHVAELRARERDRVVGVPAAPAEERRARGRARGSTRPRGGHAPR